jgi:hypothetical protein
MPSIDLSAQTYKRLQRRATPFEDSPESVIVRLLGDDPEPGDSPGPSRPRRAQVGTLLPEQEYWVPILTALVEQKGAGPAIEIIDRVGELLDQRLTEDDRGHTESGAVRWRKRTQFARLRMKERGFLDADSPRGIWAITATGREYLGDQQGGTS